MIRGCSTQQLLDACFGGEFDPARPHHPVIRSAAL
jgi:hypothetical protein